MIYIGRERIGRERVKDREREIIYIGRERIGRIDREILIQVGREGAIDREGEKGRLIGRESGLRGLQP